MSTADRDQVKSQEVPSHNIMDGTSVPHTVLRATPLDQNHPQPATRPVDRSVIWSHSVDDQPYADFRSGPLVLGGMDW